jgi:nucleotide-binding universal stress UspA family protein
MNRILVPTDFSEPSLAAVRSGIDLATAVGGVVLLLHVVEGAPVRCYVVGGLPLFFSDMIDLGGAYVRRRFEPQLIRRDICEEARWKLDALVPPRCRAHVHTMVTVGRAGEEIVRVATTHDADVILLGAGGRRRWRHVLRRTMADRVGRKVRIPVITLDPDDLYAGGDWERWGVPDHRIRSGRTISHRAALVGVVRETDGAPRLPHAEPTASPCEAVPDGLEPPARPNAARRDAQGGRQAQPRSRASRV